jgi:hypothetical protein
VLCDGGDDRLKKLKQESEVVTLALQEPHSFHLVDEIVARICRIKQINYVPIYPSVKSM